jgi:hypothetical protein
MKKVQCLSRITSHEQGQFEKERSQTSEVSRLIRQPKKADDVPLAIDVARIDKGVLLYSMYSHRIKNASERFPLNFLF